ncbi:hypothetical protein BN1263250008 [Stenotrophomonas indicatrix]|nr:hypothetical protein BN1263250008 [Stenotrophomonas indicatrix]
MVSLMNAGCLEKYLPLSPFIVAFALVRCLQHWLRYSGPFARLSRFQAAGNVLAALPIRSSGSTAC